MPPQDHADAQLVQTGMEPHVSVVSEEDNGALKQNNVFAHQETGTDSPVFHVLLDNNGTQLTTHAHAQPILTGTALTAEHVQETTDIGVINLTIVFAEQETGTEPNVLFAQKIPTGMERLVSLVMEVDCGIQTLWFANVLMTLNGTEFHVSRPVLMEKPSLTVFAFAHKANLNKKENVLTTQLVKPDSNGMESNVLEFHVSVVLHSTQDADVVKPQFMPAPPVPIGMVTDVFSLLTSAQLVWFGKIIVANQTHQNALVILMNSMANVFHCQLNANQVSPGTTPMDVSQLQTLAQLVLITTVLNVFHINHVIREESGTTLYLNVSALKELSQMVKNVSDVPQVNSTLLEVAIAQSELSSMEPNVPLCQLTNVLESQAQTGTELIVFVSQDSQQLEAHAIVMVSSLVTIVKDVQQNQTLSSPTVSVNVTMVMLMLMELVH